MEYARSAYERPFGESRQDAGAGVTHVIVEPDAVDHVPPQLLPTGGGKRSGSKPPPALVTAEWLAACLAQHGRASEVPYTVVAGAPRGGCSPVQPIAHVDLAFGDSMWWNLT